MTESAPIEAAWKELSAFADAANGLRLSEARAIFAIGSLPGGYFRPGRSDLDVLVIFHGAPEPKAKFSAAQQDEKERLEALAAQAAPYEIELIFLHETRLRRDPQNGRFPYADFTQRLLSQSKLLWGAFDLGSLETPEIEDITCAFRRYLEYLRKKHGDDFLRQGALTELLKHALVLMRTYLQVQRRVLEYDKTQLARRYGESFPAVPLPSGLTRALEAWLANEAFSGELEAAARAELPVFHAALVEEILRLTP